MVERGVDQLICLCERAVQVENNAGDRFHTEKIYQKVEGDTKIRGFFSPFSYIGVRKPDGSQNGNRPWALTTLKNCWREMQNRCLSTLVKGYRRRRSVYRDPTMSTGFMRFPTARCRY